MRKKGRGCITISTTIAQDLHKKSIDLDLSWSEALRIGLTYMISKADGETEYRNPIQLERRISELVEKLESVAQEKARLEGELYKFHS